MKNKLALSSLALDLKRMALAYHRGSEKVAARFFEEALKRKQEVDVSKIKPYVVDLLDKSIFFPREATFVWTPIVFWIVCFIDD